MKKSFIQSEVKGLFTNKKLLIAVSAVLFIPILYAGMFLWAFWDPYENLADIPVAVVNNDDGYLYEGEQLELGSELIDRLKEEPEFNFQFVDEDKGNEGLKNQDYYILIEIPHFFSKNSTTVMNDKPEKVELIYKPNESYNFLASQIGETAMLQIEMALEEKMIETYAEVIFDSIDEVADGLAEAGDATKQLSAGATDLKEGSGKIKENLLTLASKTIEFSDGVTDAHDGASDLMKGTAALSVGIAELYDNSNKLYDASRELQAGTTQLAGGISDVHHGLDQINDQVPQLIQGTEQVYDGLGELHDQLPKELTTKIYDSVLDARSSLREQFTNTILDKKIALLPPISERITDELAASVTPLIVQEANQFIHEPITISSEVSHNIISFVKQTEANQKDQLKQQVTTILQSASVPEETINEVTKQFERHSINYDEVEKQLQSRLEDSLNNILINTQISEAQQQRLQNLIKDKGAPKIEAGLNETFDNVTANLDNTLEHYESLLMAKLDEITNQLELEMNQGLISPIGQLQNGLSQVNTGQMALQTGVNQLTEGTSQLKGGSQELVDGQTNYVSNMNQFTTSFSKAKDGSDELVIGSNQLFNGLYLLKDASRQISDGTNQLADGSVELDDGLVILAQGAEQFNEEMEDAVNEIEAIEGTDETYNMIANPVKVENEKIHDVPNYGTGFAPYFLSLGLFVGALLLSIVYPLREPEGTPTSGFNWFLGKFIILFAIGVIQALIASAILLIGLKIEVQSIPLFILFAILTSLVFITLIQFLVTCLDDPGRFIAIILLIMQLTTSAGTFPLELIPKALQPFNLILPMTYSVEGFKAVISSEQFNVMWQNAGVLLLFTIAFMLLTLSYFMIMYKRKFGAISEKQVTSL